MSEPHISTEPERHEQVAELVRALEAQAPPRLHRRVQEMVDARAAPRRRARGGALTAFGPRLRPTLVAMALAALAGAAIALLSGPSTHAPAAGPSLSAASRLTLAAATAAAPRESRTRAAQLDVAMDGVAFPYWEEPFGWRASGMRTDTLGGRTVRTVYYTGHRDGRIGYAIVAGTPAPAVRGGTVLWHGGTAYRLQSLDGSPVVTWQRHGRLCVLSGRGVSAATLVRLAAWGEGARPA